MSDHPFSRIPCVHVAVDVARPKGWLTAVRRRLDVELVRRGLAASREAAQQRIVAGEVRVGGAVADKPARRTGADEPIELVGPPPRFVSRGGHKLEAALDGFSIDVSGSPAIDAGASTGGFTDCLLQRGASAVTAIDVGYGQLHERLRADPRVRVVERRHIRDCGPGEFGRVPLVVADLSFISLSSVLDALLSLVAPGGRLVVLVKPQFEAGRTDADRGRGVIRDPEVWRRVLVTLRSDVEARRAAMMGLMISPITGAQGNVEFLALVVPVSSGETASSVDDRTIETVLDDARRQVAQVSS